MLWDKREPANDEQENEEIKNTHQAKGQQRSVVKYASDVKEKRRALIFFFNLAERLVGV